MGRFFAAAFFLFFAAGFAPAVEAAAFFRAIVAIPFRVSHRNLTRTGLMLAPEYSAQDSDCKERNHCPYFLLLRPPAPRR